MNEKSQAEPPVLVEDASTFTQFINMIGDISQAWYLAQHPEECEELPIPIEMNEDRNGAQSNEYANRYASWHTKLQEVCV